MSGANLITQTKKHGCQADSATGNMHQVDRNHKNLARESVYSSSFKDRLKGHQLRRVVGKGGRTGHSSRAAAESNKAEQCELK